MRRPHASALDTVIEAHHHDQADDIELRVRIPAWAHAELHRDADRNSEAITERARLVLIGYAALAARDADTESEAA